MNVRPIRADGLPQLLGLYAHLHPSDDEMATLELAEATPLEQSRVVELVTAAVALNASRGDPTSLPPRGNAGAA